VKYTKKNEIDNEYNTISKYTLYNNMYSDIETKIIQILEKNMPNEGIAMFEEIDFTQEELNAMNSAPVGVNDIEELDYYSENFLNSFKNVIDNYEGDKIILVLEKIVDKLTEQHNNVWPINPNKNEFSSVTKTKIVSFRVMDIIEQKFRYQ